ncbi:MAG: ABC transporter ATP-binding protein [Brevinematales bacterium]
MIKFENVTKDYGNGKGIFNISVSFESGIIGVLGENGAGKTTMFKLILGLLKPDQGIISINGKNLWELNNIVETKKIIGYLPPDDYLFPYLTGRENLELISYLKNGKTSTWLDIMPYIELLDMQEVINTPLHTYSSGMKKKLHLIASLIGKPPILIWDEPYNQLDISAILKMKTLITNYAEENKATVLFASHIVEIIDELCSKVLIIHKGKILFYNNIIEKTKLIKLYIDIINKN